MLKFLEPTIVAQTIEVTIRSSNSWHSIISYGDIIDIVRSEANTCRLFTIKTYETEKMKWKKYNKQKSELEVNEQHLDTLIRNPSSPTLF